MRKLWKRTAIVFLLILGLLVLLWGGKYLFEQNYQILNGKLYNLDARTVDLSGSRIDGLEGLLRFRNPEVLDLRGTGLTPEQRKRLGETFPDCEILWQVLFQGASYPPHTEFLRIEHLSMEDLEDLDYIPGLRHVDAGTCRDYEALMALAERRPECRVDYQVELGGISWPQDARKLDLRDAGVREVREKLPWLPRVKQVNFCGTLPEFSEIEELSPEFPDIEFSWSVDLEGIEVDGEIESLRALDFRGLTLDRLEEVLPYFPGLRTLDIRGMEEPTVEKLDLQEMYPELDILWDLRIGTRQVPLDTEILDLRGEVLESVSDLELNFSLLPNLKRVELQDCGLSNKALDALNRSYPDIRIVWNVNVGGRDTRTDETYFACNKWGLTMTDRNIKDLRYCTDMICVDIGHSYSVTNCRWAAYMPHLRYLILADGMIADISPLEGLKELVFLELFQTPVEDYTPLLGCTALEDLNLCNTYGDPSPVAQMTWLKRLWWSYSNNAEEALAGKLPDTEIKFDLESATGDGWRRGQNYYDMRDLIGMGYMTG